MNTFVYLATDDQGRESRGAIAAPDWQTAQQQLEAQGLRNCRQTAPPGQGFALPALSHAQAVELAGYLVELTRLGLPLEGGLRALSRQARSGRVSQALEQLSAQLASGTSLEASLGSLVNQLPTGMARMLGMAGRPGESNSACGEMLSLRQENYDMRASFWQAVAYPATVFGFFLVWILFVCLWLIPHAHLRELFDDYTGFGDLTSIASDSPPSRPVDNVIEFARIMPRGLLACLIALVVLVAGAGARGGRAAVSRLCAHVPLLGPAWRYCGLVEFSSALAFCLRRHAPLPEALAEAADLTSDPAVRAACRRSAAEVEAGISLARCLQAQPYFPSTLVQLVAWGEDHGALSDSLLTAQQLFRDRFDLQREWIRLALPPIIFLIVGCSAFFLVGVLRTLVKLLVDLS